MLESLPIFVLIIYVSYVAVILIRKWSLRNMLDIPGHRSSHTQPMPSGGGISIVVISLGGLALVAMVQGFTPPTAAYLIGGVLVATVSLVDDYRQLSSAVRLCVHTIAAVIVVWGVGSFSGSALPFADQIDTGPLMAILTVAWVVAMINIYNFMDGIDGIAGSQAVVAGLGLSIIALSVNQTRIALLMLLVLCSSVGFLLHNWPPAKIFMGDVGSAFLGYTFAVVPVVLTGDIQHAWLIGVLVMWPFVFDASCTLIRRVSNKENILVAHRSHLYQRLVLCGLSHRTVTSIYVAMALWGAITGVVLTLAPVSALGVVMLLFIPVIAIIHVVAVQQWENQTPMSDRATGQIAG